MTIRAKCIKVHYEEGGHMCIRSRTRIAPRYLRGLRKRGLKVTNRYTGWADVVKPAGLALMVRIDGEEYEIPIYRFFRGQFARFTKKRREAIQATMPAMIEVVEQMGHDGKSFTVPDHELEAWLQRVLERENPLFSRST